MAASSTFFLTLSLLAMFWVILQSHHGEAFGTFGFNFHHRYSDPVTTILDLQGLPEKGSVEYYSSWVSRDKHRLNNGRRLAESGGNSSLLTFEAGNETARLVNLGYLHYANVTVGTPPLSFIVALDTGSDLFWLPCDCNNSCVQGLLIGTERQIDFNTYSPNASSTSHIVQCNDTMCGQKSQCSVERNACGYKVAYLSSETSSSGILVNDVLHLATDNTKQKSIKAPITFGCGIRQTGAFLDSAAPNGLFGLGTDDTSVPSILAANGLAPKSFSMCFGKEGLGRIVFGDKGGSNLSETPLNLDHSHPTYNISLTQIAVERNVTNVDFTAIFDSGTSFTLLRDPAYTIITENFNSKAKEPRHNFTSDSGIPFEYCYDLSPNQTYVDVPRVYLTMKGGDQFEVFKPVELLCNETCIYCLAIVTNGSINIIGQNFMTGQRVIFDSEKLVLGWEPSADCNDVGSKQSNTTTTLPVNKQRPAAEAPSPTTIVPEATSGNGGAVPTTPHSGNNASHLKSSFFSTLTLLSSLFLSFS
ncbi:unnamed protein product [Cuscuta epithymum]|uniref:Peptidase A1 domain-containing protein n=1 Tax=Cuscuta epithymum TaxID=186058 RepID=A0AAV0FD14_9ASTE|nr:unnamed protein product [Cuscuta epithymum]CAH9117686.1 unnamed protein product [Cuscuta epithymum]CAH9133478.1 unnamed protein product [Cuscuta epithymum]